MKMQSACAPSLARSLTTYTPLGSPRGITNDSVGRQRHSVRPVDARCEHGGWRTVARRSLCSASRPPVPPYQPIRNTLSLTVRAPGALTYTRSVCPAVTACRAT